MFRVSNYTITQTYFGKKRFVIISRYHHDINIDATAVDLYPIHPSTVTRLEKNWNWFCAWSEKTRPSFDMEKSWLSNCDCRWNILWLSNINPQDYGSAWGGGDFSVGHMSVYQTLKEMKYMPYISTTSWRRRQKSFVRLLGIRDVDFEFVDRIL